MAGGRIEIDVVPNLDNFNSTLNRSLNSALKIGAAFGVSFGAATAFSEIVSLGNDLTNTLNTMQSVSSATASEMAAVSARAKELGNDISLSNTSATDAAAAMTELAKGGFTVQQAMDGAKGTLQLAAAAGIDAASAATIQSQALQAFGLSADYAATAADVLANAANASSAEITDISAGLQQSGAVANQFGLTIEDTAATLGVLSNAGIAGSDAGTLLKSALLALTDQGKPAQAAIEELGLTVYDAQGQFVGMSALFGQLDAAAASMTPELYQAATATLFGSDAMRLAGVAAEQGQVGYDKMHTAIERQGAAAEVAAAKSKGLPGAMAAIQNSAETLALEIYDLIDGPMEQYAREGAEKLTGASGGIIDAFKTVGSTLAPIVGVLGSAATAVASLPGPVLAATGALVALRVTGVGSALAGAVTATTAATSRFTTAMAAQAFAAAAAGRQMGLLGAATAVAGARVGTGAKAVLSAFGGPWMLGIVAAGAAVFAINNEFKNLEAQQDAITGSARDISAAQRDMAKAFQESNGAVSDNVLGAVGIQIDEVREKANALAENGPGAFGIFAAAGSDIKGWFSGVAEAGTDAMEAQEALAEQGAKTESGLRNLNKTNEEVAAAVAGSDAEWNALADGLRGTADGGAEALAALQPLREEFVKAQTTAKNTTPGFFDLRDAVKVLSDESSSATDRINAMKTALDVLSGKPIPLSDALQTYNDQVRATAEATTDVWAAADGWGDALIGQNGTVNTATANGSKLRDALTEIKDATVTAAEAGADMAPIWAQNEQQLEQLSTATGVSVDALRTMIETEGLIPKNVEMLAALRGADTVEQQLQIIGGLLRGVGQPVEIPVDALTDDAKAKIIALGGSVEENINGKPGIVRLSAPNQEALDAIQAVNYELNGLPVDNATKLRIDGVKTALEEIGTVQGALDNLSGRRTATVPKLNIPTPGGVPLPGGRADGGRLPTTGPGTNTVDGILGVSSAGMPLARVDAGEWVVNGDSSEKYNRELSMINAGTFPKLPGFNSGGVVGGMQEWVDQVAPGLSMTSGLRNTDDGYHSTGNAADFSNGSGNTPEQLALAQAISEAYPDSLELIYDDPAFAGQEIKNGARVDSSFYDGAGNHTNHVHWAMSAPPSLDRMPGGNGGIALSERDQIAQAIIEEGKRRGITRNGIRAALAAGLAESDLQNLPYGDRDSTGVFQQRNNGAWGTAEDRMDPTRAAGMFYEKLAAFDYESMDAAAAAQRVQQSAFADGSNYAARMAEADAVLAASEARSSGYTTSAATGFNGAANADWAEKDKLALDSAMVAVRQAQEDRDATFVNDKKTQADRDQADIKVAQAEQKVRDLEAKRDTVTASKDDKTPAPNAPELTTNFSDEEIGLKSAELAVEKARLARNEVYAEAGVTEAEKLDADLSLQRAKNALDAERKSQAEGTSTGGSGGSATASNPVDLIGNVAKSFVTGQLGDALGVIGLSEDMGSIGALVTGIANYKPVDGSEAATGLKQLYGNAFADQLGMAAELNPDMKFDPQEWMRKLADQLLVPAVLRDSGGPLPHGMAALNLSGDTEHVYTGKQNGDMFKELASIRAAVGGQNSSSVDLSGISSQIDRLADTARQPTVQYHVTDIKAAFREDEIRRNRQARAFTRR
ncbi:phage tail tape measure protein [Rhodococcoides fascians]|uniref:phage tail tape measure protein n=1 Tax=Rhodococcoides fascians TaxID=1828 RepID=UPI00050CF925|nr:phage tail tape measure protein [Rhodococcus fascians]